MKRPDWLWACVNGCAPCSGESFLQVHDFFPCLFAEEAAVMEKKHLGGSLEQGIFQREIVEKIRRCQVIHGPT